MGTFVYKNKISQKFILIPPIQIHTTGFLLKLSYITSVSSFFYIKKDMGNDRIRIAHNYSFALFHIIYKKI